MFPQFKSFKKQIQPTIKPVDIGPNLPSDTSSTAIYSNPQHKDEPITEYKKEKKDKKKKKEKEEIIDEDFSIDRKRDLDNLKYDSIRNQAIPIYRKRKDRKKQATETRYYLEELFDDEPEPQEITNLKETSDFIPLDLPFDFEKFKKEKPKTITGMMKNEPLERQIAILERAISETGDVEFVYQLLEKTELVWDTRKVLDTWDRYLMQYEDVFDLWIKYLDFRQRSVVSFKFTKILDIYKEIIDLKLYENEKVRLLLHLAVFLYKCGYTEYSICLYQANIEYNYFYHPDFEEYFDLEYPLFGMEGSLGCKNYYNDGWDLSLLKECVEDVQINEDIGNIEDIEMSNDGEISDDDEYQRDLKINEMERKKLEKFKEYESNWYKKERRLSKYFLPLRNSTNDQQTDPYRTVLFQDIDPFLFRIQSSEMVFDFLNLLGLPIQTRSKGVYRELFNLKRLDEKKYPIVNYCTSPEFLFNRTQPPITIELLNDIEPKLDFILNVLKQSIEIDDIFLYYYLYIRYLQDKSNIKECKAYLAKDPMNLRLYNFYAQLLDNPAKSSQIYQKILSIATYPKKFMAYLDLCLLSNNQTEAKTKSKYSHLIELKKRPSDFEYVYSLPQDEELYQHTLLYIQLVPKEYRKLLEKYLSLYPENTLFKTWLFETEQHNYYKQWLFKEEDELFKKWAFNEKLVPNVELNKWLILESGNLDYVELMIEKEFRICQ
ncbi:hypothetical protein HDV06_001251 [Boothiomyces sp. JEL0866]|nr:hypothetical protein HDV06_001251 [Boothiomyces sp. JEL0866]